MIAIKNDCSVKIQFIDMQSVNQRTFQVQIINSIYVLAKNPTNETTHENNNNVQLKFRAINL